MRLNTIRSAALSVFLAPIAAASVIYSDGNFTPGTWGIEITQANAGGTATAVQSAATGNPGAAFRVQTTVYAASGGPSTVWALHRYGTTMATRYEPATQGAIGALTYSLDYRLVQGFGDGHGFTFAIKQGQTTYIGPYTTTGSSGVWRTFLHAGLTAADFSRLDGQPGMPDFSETGQPIRFGFVTSNTTLGISYSITVDYDNFRVVVVPPCPADFNADGGVDGSDVIAFFAAWEAGAAAADVNKDGGIDGSDVEAFFAVWEAGGCEE